LSTNDDLILYTGPMLVLSECNGNDVGLDIGTGRTHAFGGFK